MKKYFYLLAALMVFSNLSFGAAAENDPKESLKSEAFSKIKVGQDLVGKANKYMANKPTRDDLKMALQLYAQAGQLFQEASNVLKYIGPDYATKEDIEGSAGLAVSCLDAINKLKELLGKMPA
jgi:hypothetical protein